MQAEWYLDVVPLVIVTALTEKPVMHNVVDVQLIKEWIAVLYKSLIISQLAKQIEHRITAED